MLDDKILLEKAKKVIQNKEIEKQVFGNKKLKEAFLKAMESKQKANDDWLMFIYKLDRVNHKRRI